MKNIFNIVERIYEYPDKEMLLNGVETDSTFAYISDTYLNGFINYVDVLCGAMIRAYAYDDEEWQTFCDNIEALKDEYHTDVSNAEKFDSIIVLAESKRDYWLFYSDRDCSDCSITRIGKYHFKNKDEVIASFNHNIETHAKERTGADKIKLMDKSLFTGWITL